MADIKDLKYASIMTESNDEAVERLRQIRLSRRIPDKPKKTKASAAKKSQNISIDSASAAEILKILGEQ
jgi:hypothetical protein